SGATASDDRRPLGGEGAPAGSDQSQRRPSHEGLGTHPRGGFFFVGALDRIYALRRQWRPMTLPQQALLRDAMRRLDMTRDAFAERIGSRRRALDTWLLPDDSGEFRAMPEVVRRFVQEILANSRPQATDTTQSVYS